MTEPHANFGHVLGTPPADVRLWTSWFERRAMAVEEHRSPRRIARLGQGDARCCEQRRGHKSASCRGLTAAALPGVTYRLTIRRPLERRSWVPGRERWAVASMNFAVLKSRAATSTTPAPKTFVDQQDASHLTRKERRALDRYNRGTGADKPLADRFAGVRKRPATVARRYAG